VGGGQPLKEHDHFVTALGGRKFKTENFRCAHRGDGLFGAPFFERGGRAYCESSFLELFRECPGCLDPVALDDPAQVHALGAVWHAQHLVCVACAADGTGAPAAPDGGDGGGGEPPRMPPPAPSALLLGRQCYAHDASDGRGAQPYCEGCYTAHFCPPCGGCGEPINPALEDVLEASGAFW